MTVTMPDKLERDALIDRDWRKYRVADHLRRLDAITHELDAGRQPEDVADRRVIGCPDCGGYFFADSPVWAEHACG